MRIGDGKGVGTGGTEEGGGGDLEEGAVEGAEPHFLLESVAVDVFGCGAVFFGCIR